MTTYTIRPIGAPTKLTPALQDHVCKLISEGNYITTACVASGISARTYDRWTAQAEDVISQYGEDSEESRNNPFVIFYLATKKAHAEAEAKLLKVIESASITNWQAAAWILERTKPDKYARREQINLHDNRALELLTAIKRASEMPEAASLSEAMQNVKVIAPVKTTKPKPKPKPTPKLLKPVPPESPEIVPSSGQKIDDEFNAKLKAMDAELLKEEEARRVKAS